MLGSSIGSYHLAYGAWILGLVCLCLGFFSVVLTFGHSCMCKKSIYNFYKGKKNSLYSFIGLIVFT